MGSEMCIRDSYCTLEDALPVLKVIGDIYKASGEHACSVTRAERIEN